MNPGHELLVVSGPNGSGKTTLAEFYSADFGYPYLGADKIAAELSPADPASQSVTASREFSRRLKSAVSNDRSIWLSRHCPAGLSCGQFVPRVPRGFGFRLCICFLAPQTCVLPAWLNAYRKAGTTSRKWMFAADSTDAQRTSGICTGRSVIVGR
jgi:hypothetical protein